LKQLPSAQEHYPTARIFFSGRFVKSKMHSTVTFQNIKILDLNLNGTNKEQVHPQYNENNVFLFTKQYIYNLTVGEQ
jgi:hypothetical protein